MPRLLNLLLASNLIFSSNASLAAEVLIQAPGAPSSDYRAMLRADSRLTSVSAQFSKSHPSAVSREKLLASFSKAQADFLGASTETAAASFSAVTALITADDWSATERAIFLTAFMRRAQLESDPAKQAELLRQSHLAGQDLQPDSSLFPPPLLEKRRELKRDLIAVSRSTWSPDWNLILINGRMCSEKSCGAWPRGSDVRVTLVSDRWITQTFTTKSEQLENLKPKAVAWAEGDCQKPKMATAAEKAFGDHRVFWGLNCEKSEPRQLKLSPVADNSGIPVLAETKTKTPIYKSPWLWAGVGVVAAFLIIQGNQNKKSTEATTTYGFQ